MATGKKLGNWHNPTNYSYTVRRSLFPSKRSPCPQPREFLASKQKNSLFPSEDSLSPSKRTPCSQAREFFILMAPPCHRPRRVREVFRRFREVVRRFRRERRANFFRNLDRVGAIVFVKKSSKSELSSRFFSRLKIFGSKRPGLYWLFPTNIKW